MRAQGYRRARSVAAWLLTLSAVGVLSACDTRGDEPVRQGSAGGRPRIGHIEPPPGHVNPVIVGEDLSQLPGEAGEYFRKRVERERIARENNPWVQPVDQDLGKHRLGKVVKGSFEIRNPRDRDHNILGVDSSCSCQKVVLELNGKRREIAKGSRERILVPQGATGKIEIHVEIQQLEQRSTSVMLRLDDPELPFLRLTAQTQGVMDFIVEHEGRPIEDLFLGTFGMRESKPWELRVTALDGKPFEITKALELPAGFEVSFEAIGADRLAWRVFGRAGPDLPEAGFIRSILLQTRDDRRIEFRLTGFVTAPYRVSPSFLNFGHVDAAKGSELSIEVESLEEDFSVLVKSAEWIHSSRETREGTEPFDAKKLGLEVQGSDSGAKSVIAVKLPPGLPTGRLEARMRLTFANPKLPPREVKVVAFVR